jgi:hypothetical protein
MRSTVFRPWLLFLGLAFSPTPSLSAQFLYAGFGGGPTPVLGEGSGNRNWSGMVGYQGRGALGARLSGVETASRLWLGAELTFQLNPGEGTLRPYALLGPGYVLDFSEDDVLFTAGAGLRAQAHRLLFFFGEVRLHTILGSPSGGPSTILPITLGVGAGH